MKESLRFYAQRLNLHIGAACSPSTIEQEPEYAAVLAREFNCLTAENGMKFKYLQPEPGNFCFDTADKLIDFASANGQSVRGHTLAWHTQLADWAHLEMRNDSTRAECILRNHIGKVVAHFRQKVFCWDVVNEALADDGRWRAKSPWFAALGPEYLDIAFKAAHEADPDALLFYNDYGIEQPGDKAEAAFQLVGKLLERGTPLHGVGLQYHLGSENILNPDDIVHVIDTFASMGLQVHLTEMDMGIPVPVTREKRLEQAVEYRKRIQSALVSPAVSAIVFWGFSDRHSWIPSFSKGSHDEPLPFDREYLPKPAYHSIVEALQNAQKRT